jgi:hypothetical protein
MNNSRNVPLMGDFNTVVCMDEVNSCISGSRSFIIFLYFIHLRRKLNSLERYDIAQNYRILHRVVHRYSNITSKFHTIAIFKNCAKQTTIRIKLIGMSMISYYTRIHLSKCNGSWVVSTKRTMNFNIQMAAMFVFFLSDKNGLIKSFSSFEDLSVY